MRMTKRVGIVLAMFMALSAWHSTAQGARLSPVAGNKPKRSLAQPQSAAQDVTFKISESTLVKIDENTDVVKNSTSASPDARRFAFAVKKADKQAVVIDGVEGTEYDGEIMGLRFSPDSKRVVYSIDRDKKWRIVLDGVASEEYDNADFDFSPDAKHVAYIARQGNEYILFSDGVEGKHWGVRFDESGYPEPTFVAPHFSPDSQRIAYQAMEGGQMMINVGGINGAKYDYCVSPNFSPDSKRVAYWAARNGKWLVVVNGEEGREYDDYAPNSIEFSPDSRHLVYSAQRGRQWYVVADGEEKSLPDEAFSYYSPDSKHLISSVFYEGTKEHRYLDGVELAGGEEVSNIGFSADGSRMSYSVQRGEKSVVNIDGVESKVYDGSCGQPVFSPDSKRVKYEVYPEILKNSLVVVDGVEGKQYDHTQWFCFSPDSKHFAYAARRSDKWIVVIDGLEAKEYDGIMSRLVFDSSSTLHWLALRGGKEILQVKAQIAVAGQAVK